MYVLIFLIYVLMSSAHTQAHITLKMCICAASETKLESSWRKLARVVSWGTAPILFFLLCVLICMFVHHLGTWCPQRPEESQIPWNWNYTQLGATPWVLGSQIGSSGRAASPLNHKLSLQHPVPSLSFICLPDHIITESTCSLRA